MKKKIKKVPATFSMLIIILLATTFSCSQELPEDKTPSLPTPAYLPKIDGIEEGSSFREPVNISWIDKEDCKSKIYIKKDEEQFIEYAQGSIISASGNYQLMVVTTRISNGEKITRLLNFSIDFKAKVIGFTEGSTYTYYAMAFVKPMQGTEVSSIKLFDKNNTPRQYFAGDMIKIDGKYAGTNGQYRLEVVTTRLSDGQIASETINFKYIANNLLPVIKTNLKKSGTALTIDFNHKTYDKYGDGNQKAPAFAIWTESLDGDFIENLYLSSMTATNYVKYEGRWEAKPHSLPYWSHRVCQPKSYLIDEYFVEQEAGAPRYTLHLSNMDDMEKYPDLDTVTGATPWADYKIETVTGKKSGKLKILLELNQSLDYGWYYGENSINSQATSNIFYMDSGEPALVYAVDIDLDSPQTVYEMSLIGYSHFAGENGQLYTDFTAVNGQGQSVNRFEKATEMVEKITVTIKR